MLRLAPALCFAFVAACSSGFSTGSASLTGITPTIQSAGANSFTMADGSGNMVLGWKLEFFSDGPNADCLSTSLNELADLFIYTQTPASQGGKATIGIGEIDIVTANPPTFEGNGDLAHFSIDGVHSVAGVIELTTSTNKIFEGTVDAAGTGSDGTDVNITGMFNAPVCE